MKIAVVYFDALQGGGYPRDIRWLAGALSRRGLDVSLVAHPGLHTDGLESVDRIDPRYFPSRISRMDVIHVWMLFVPHQFGSWRRFQDTVPIVVSPAAHLLPAHLKRKWWKKYPFLLRMQPAFLRSHPVAHLFSEAERPGARRWLHASAYFQASLGVFPTAMDSNPARPRDYLLFFGRNDIYQKGIDILVRAYADASRAGLRLPLVIAGQPNRDSKKALDRIITDLGVMGEVRVVGEVTEDRKVELIRGARCLAFLSRWDGPPRPVREAIALGTPVVVSRGTNLGDIVEAARAGVSVDLRREEVAEALLETQNDEVVKVWERGAVALRSDLSWDRVAERYAAGYRLATDS